MFRLKLAATHFLLEILWEFLIYAFALCVSLSPSSRTSNLCDFARFASPCFPLSGPSHLSVRRTDTNATSLRGLLSEGCHPPSAVRLRRASPSYQRLRIAPAGCIMLALLAARSADWPDGGGGQMIECLDSAGRRRRQG